MFNRRNAIHGGLIYAGGDSIATLISGEFQIVRALGMLLLGATLYAVEIPAYFGWIERHAGNADPCGGLKKAVLAQAFFNPVWIARHIAFIQLFSGRIADIGWYLLAIGTDSFLHMLPVALPVNYAIQNLVPLKRRFLASSLFSALTAIYFSLSEVLFG